MSSANCTIYTSGIGTHTQLQSHLCSYSQSLKDSDFIGIFYCFSNFGTILIITDREVLGQYCYWSGCRGFFFCRYG